MDRYIFKRSPNYFKSFWDLNVNNIKVTDRNGLIAQAIIFLILIGAGFFFGVSSYLKFLSLFLPIFLPFAAILWFVTYLGVLKSSSIFNIKGIKFEGENGFSVVYKDDREEFIDYQNVNEINYRFYPWGSGVAGLIRSAPLRAAFSHSKHFLIQSQNNAGVRKEIAISLDIADVYKALSIIVNHIPEEKRGNVKLEKGKVAVFIDRKTSCFGKIIDLDTKKGQLILVIFAIIVLGFWVSITFFFLHPFKIPSIHFPSLSILSPKSQIEDWKTYTNTEYGFEMKYPAEVYFSSQGPNSEQQAINKGEQISGTTQPSYDTIVFSDSSNELGKIEIFYKYEKVILSKNYKDESIPYLYGPCDIRWGFAPISSSSILINSIDVLMVRGKANNNSYVCYYFKNLSGNLIVFSNTGYKSDVFNQMLSTLKFLESAKVSEEIRISMPDINSFDLANKTFEALDFERQKIKVLVSDSTKFYQTINFENHNWKDTYYTFPEFYSLIKNWSGPGWWFMVRGVFENEETIKADEIFYYVQ